MKKAVSILVILLSIFGLMTGCSAEYQDGVYHAEFSDYDSHGWKEYVDVQVQDNTVTVFTPDGEELTVTCDDEGLQKVREVYGEAVPFMVAR